VLNRGVEDISAVVNTAEVWLFAGWLFWVGSACAKR